MNYRKYLVKAGVLATGLAMAIAMPMAAFADRLDDSGVFNSPDALNIETAERSFDLHVDLNGADSSLEFKAEFAHPVMDNMAFAKKIFNLVGLGDRFAMAEVKTEDMGELEAKFEEQTLSGGEIKLEIKIDQDGMVEIEFEQTGTEAEILDRAMTIQMNAAMHHQMMMPMQM